MSSQEKNRIQDKPHKLVLNASYWVTNTRSNAMVRSVKGDYSAVVQFDTHKLKFHFDVKITPGSVPERSVKELEIGLMLL